MIRSGRDWIGFFINDSFMEKNLALWLQVIRTTSSDHCALSLRVNCAEVAAEAVDSWLLQIELRWFKEEAYA